MTQNLGSFPSQTPLFQLRIWGTYREVTESHEREWGRSQGCFFPVQGCVFVSLSL
uniref:Alternative protein SLC17A7 n=1 Tax=Homo sapiens TaxID=9606 RepID=L8EA60_HUMAN|nr:alternative protein SLC17A7 [Homo sapiens]